MLFNKDKLNLRLYQQTILNSASSQNTLVVLPTGLGKTHIAIALSNSRLKDASKILILAPTKPLALQHMNTFSEFFEPQEELCLLTGEVAPAERKELWSNSKIIFSTPQTIRNDMIYGQINLKDVSLIVFDEAHRAVGDYAYVFIAENYVKQTPNSRILALTASPGSDEYKVDEVCKNLFIKKIEYRSRENIEVKDYVKEIEVTYKSVTLPDEIIAIKSRLERAAQERLSKLKQYGFVKTDKLDGVTKKALLYLQLTLRKQFHSKNFAVARGISVCASIIKLRHMISLVESESLAALNSYFESMWEEERTTKIKSVKDVVNDVNVRAAYTLTRNALENNLENPKLELLKEIVQEQMSLKAASKILVFTEYRANIPKILSVLSDLPMDTHHFIGQGKKGMNQKTQAEVIEKFREGYLNCLVCTSVAEEGLDIPQVDLIVLYTPVPSAIKNIQRRGRTGRQEIGKTIILMASNTADQRYAFIARRKERKMDDIINTLSENKKTFEKVPVAETLDNYTTQKTALVFADSREHGAVIDHLYKSGINVKVGQLKAGDFIISEDIGVERKTTGDFVNSLIDKRLFEQAQKMKQNFVKPIYIIEGKSEDLFSVRNVDSRAILGAMVSLIVDWQLPVIFSRNPEETADIIANLAKREQFDRNKKVSVRFEQKPKILTEQQQYFIEGLPNIGPTAARNLLKHFKTPRSVTNASLDGLKEVEGIGTILAEQIRKLLDEEYKD